MRADWMKSIDGSKLLSQLSIPGTHDTCTYNVSWVQWALRYVQCQDDSLTTQLEKGIRCLDIRARHFKDNLTIHHGSAYLDMNFSDVMNICESFLEKHSGETIVMFVKDEYDEEGCTNKYHETFLRYMDEKKGLFYLREDVPALSDVRGKIVLLRRFASPQTLGIDLSDWRDDTAFSISHPPVTFHIQDEYKVHLLKFGKKWERVKSLLDDARAKGPSTTDWYINFTSAVGPSPRRVADGNPTSTGIMPHLQEYLRAGENAGHVGTVLMDFPRDDVIANIISRNG